MPKRFSLDKLRGRTPLVWIWAAVIISLCILVSAVWMSPLATYIGGPQLPLPGPAQLAVAPPSPPPEEPQVQVPAKRSYLRVGSISTEGLGSTLHHFKHSIVLAAALDSSLIFSWDVIYDAKFEIDVYSTSRIWNGEESPIGNRAPSLNMDARKVCRISDHVRSEDRAALVRGICSGEDSASSQMEKIRLDMQDCTSIVDTEYSEHTQDMNGCIMGWLRDRLAPDSHFLPSTLSLPPNRPITVGVHIRWGDTRSDFKELAGTQLYGSMALPNVVRILKDIRDSPLGEHGVKLTVLMQLQDPEVLAILDETELNYTVVDSGDTVGDLYKLSNNDILLVGESSYGVLAHLIAPPGLTIVEMQAHLGKYTNTSGFGRNVVELDNYTPNDLLLAVGNSMSQLEEEQADLIP
ncbi:hypothetical protein MSAN_01633800 [Mycena sanguinolenta]|uniref:Uncharacterized protein n=1 Tax=Mycena sanguinolenta TaxID=230812 RepID=A0A8H7CWG2_9AGAR|nr:hypothetical protein MSAN_01633800 [Mycena sanguinolenta]